MATSAQETAQNGKRRPTDAEVVDLFHWINVPRIVATALAGAIIVIFWASGDIDFDPRPLVYGLIPTYAVVTFIMIAFVRRRVTPWVLLHVQQAVDLMAITAGVFYTGGLRSPFLTLYMLVVVSSGLISRTATVVFSVIVAAIVGALALLEPVRPFVLTGMSRGFGQADPMNVAMFLIMVGLIAFQSQYYVSQIRRKDEQLLKLKDDFLFRTIHDIRSPSTIIQLILSKYDTPEFVAQYPDFKKDSEMAASALSRIGNLVEELLKIARGEGAGIVMKDETIDLYRFMGGLLAEYRPSMEKKGVMLSHEPATGIPAARGDAEKLKEALANFVDNAVKYNRQGGSIRVWYVADGEHVRVSLSDTGIGISEKSLPKMFSPYFRGDVGRDIPGTGLGLYYSKMLIEKMGGGVTVSSVKGDGTTFTVMLRAVRRA